MGTKEKAKGPDGIRLWNQIYYQLQDAQQTTRLLKEIREFEQLHTEEKLRLLIASW